MTKEEQIVRAILDAHAGEKGFASLSSTDQLQTLERVPSSISTDDSKSFRDAVNQVKDPSWIKGYLNGKSVFEVAKGAAIGATGVPAVLLYGAVQVHKENVAAAERAKETVEQKLKAATDILYPKAHETAEELAARLAQQKTKEQLISSYHEYYLDNSPVYSAYTAIRDHERTPSFISTAMNGSLENQELHSALGILSSPKKSAKALLEIHGKTALLGAGVGALAMLGSGLAKHLYTQYEINSAVKKFPSSAESDVYNTQKRHELLHILNKNLNKSDEISTAMPSIPDLIPQFKGKK